MKIKSVFVLVSLSESHINLNVIFFLPFFAINLFSNPSTRKSHHLPHTCHMSSTTLGTSTRTWEGSRVFLWFESGFMAEFRQ
jgi:hypothetical protein